MYPHYSISSKRHNATTSIQICFPMRNKKAQSSPTGLFRFNNGRDGVIRTLDPLHPMRILYGLLQMSTDITGSPEASK